MCHRSFMPCTCAAAERGSERPGGPAFRHANHLVISSSNDDQGAPAGAISRCLRPGSGGAARRTSEDRGAAAAGDSSRRAWRSQQFAPARAGLARTGQSAGRGRDARAGGGCRARFCPGPHRPRARLSLRWSSGTCPRAVAARAPTRAPTGSRVVGIRRCAGGSRKVPGCESGATSVRGSPIPTACASRRPARRSSRRTARSAELIFRDILKADASHVAALCGLAAVSLTARRAAAMRCAFCTMPSSSRRTCRSSGAACARPYVDLGRLPEAEAAVRHLLKIESENPKNWVLLGTVCTRMMRQADALVAFEEAARLNPDGVRLRLSIGHLHKTLGIAASASRPTRRASIWIRVLPRPTGVSQISRTTCSATPRLRAMQALLKGDGGDDVGQAQLHFALGRAYRAQEGLRGGIRPLLERQYRRRKTVPFDIEVFENKTRRVRECFDATFFAERARAGHPIPRRSSSSDCRDRARPWSSRFSPATRASKEPSSCRMS